MDLLGYLATIKFLRHTLFLVDSDLVGYLATFDFGNILKGCINIDLKDRSKRMDQVGSAWLPEYIQISNTYTESS